MAVTCGFDNVVAVRNIRYAYEMGLISFRDAAGLLRSYAPLPLTGVERFPEGGGRASGLAGIEPQGGSDVPEYTAVSR
jgi:hypothetical protein